MYWDKRRRLGRLGLREEGWDVLGYEEKGAINRVKMRRVGQYWMNRRRMG